MTERHTRAEAVLRAEVAKGYADYWWQRLVKGRDLEVVKQRVVQAQDAYGDYRALVARAALPCIYNGKHVKLTICVDSCRATMWNITSWCESCQARAALEARTAAVLV